MRQRPDAAALHQRSRGHGEPEVCRLFGMSAGARRARATFWLLGAPDSLEAQSHREPDGTGLGWFDERDAQAAGRGVR